MTEAARIFARARWIGSATTYAGKRVDVESPSLRLRRKFSLNEAPRVANIYISGLGAFVLYINGKRVGDERLSPAFTNYTKTVLYCEYEVSEYLTKGENLIAVELGSGFYNQSAFDGWSFCFSPWRDEEKLLLSLVCDGVEVLFSDRDFRVSECGARTYTQIRIGERYDGRVGEGWREPSFDDSRWQRATLTRVPGGVLKKQTLPPIRVCERLSPIAVIEGDGCKIYDFGRNISGVSEISARGERGSLMRVRYGEKITDGRLAQDIVEYGIKNLDTSKVEFGDRYIFSGEGRETFAAEFVYYGFRYVEVSGAIPESVTALFIHTDLKEKGGFFSSDETYNWLDSAANTAFLSNFHGFSEDCPHREKNGWTGDGAISSHHAVYRYDMIDSYRKWLSDVIDCQLLSGQYPAVAPTGIYGYTWGSGPAWDYLMFVVPDAVYRETGDSSLFDLTLEPNLKYLDYARLYENESGLVKFGLGDWCYPKKVEVPSVASNELSDSCFYYSALEITAGELSRRADPRAAEYERRRDHVRDGILKAYLKEDTVDNGSVSAMAILLDLVPLEDKRAEALAARLAERVAEEGYKISCGILGVKALFRVLSRYGYSAVCHELLHAKGYPSYTYFKDNGLLTLPECWEIDGDTPGCSSRNHHMYSSPLEWLYRYVGGIQNLGVAYDECKIAPFVFAEDASASAYTETPRGRISVSWRKSGDILEAEIEIPRNTSAYFEYKEEKIPLKEGMNSVRVRER